MAAEILAVGTELLRFGRRDENGPWLAARLERIGVDVRRICQVGDDSRDLAEELSVSLRRARVVILTGGLGPTEDDRTREGLARALGVELEVAPEALSRIEKRLASLGRPMTPEHARQAQRPRGSSWIPNPVGHAPGIAAIAGKCRVYALPGVPAEMKAMYERRVESELRGAGEPVATRVLKVAGRPESWVDRRVRDLYGFPGARVTILARPSGIELALHVTGRSADESRERLRILEEAMVERLGADLYGRDDETLPGVVGRALRDADRTLAVAESCTGGLLGGAVTQVPGSSEWFRGGVLVYTDEMKVRLAGVRPATLAAQGAVSEPVARELAAGVRQRCGADYGLAITGIAGPGGATPGKPVGLVWIGLSGPEEAAAHCFRFPGDRDLVRLRSVTAALDRLRRSLP